MAKTAAEIWFDSFLEQLKSEGFDLSNRACSMFFNDMDGGLEAKPRPALTAIKGVETELSTSERFAASAVPLDKLSLEEKNKLYYLAKSGFLSLTPLTADYKGIKEVKVAEDGSCKIELPPQPSLENPEPYLNLFYKDPAGAERSDPQDRAERTWHASLTKEMYEHPEYFGETELLKERSRIHEISAKKEAGLALEEDDLAVAENHPVTKISEVTKTLTDLFAPGQKDGKVNIEDLLSAGLLRDEKGMPFEAGDKPWDRIDRLASEAANGKPIYAVSIDGTRFVEVYPFKDPAVDLEHQPKEKLIKPAVKQGALESLNAIKKRLDALDTSKFGKDKEALDGFRAAYGATVERLEKTPFKASVDESLNILVVTAGQIYKDNVVKKAGKNKLALDDILKDIKNVGKCVSEDLDVRKHGLRIEDKQRIDIATKSVITLAKINAQSADPEVAKHAKRILEYPPEMDKQVREHMESTGFIELYGKLGQKKKDDMLSKAAAKADGKDLVKAYNAKKTELKNEKRNREEQIDRKAQSRDSTMSKGPVSPDVREDLTRMIADMKKDLDSLWHEGRTSTEFKEFKACLDMTHLRLQRKNNPYMDVKKQMASLASLADKYYLSHAGVDINRRGLKRFRQISRVRNMADAVLDNKKPSENMPTEEDMFREDLAAKMVGHAANELRRKGGDDNLFEADKLINNPRVFRKKLQEIMDSPQFRSLYGDADLATLKSDLKEASEVINGKLNEKKRELARSASIHPTKKDEKMKDIEKAQDELVFGV